MVATRRTFLSLRPRTTVKSTWQVASRSPAVRWSRSGRSWLVESTTALTIGRFFAGGTRQAALDLSFLGLG